MLADTIGTTPADTTGNLPYTYLHLQTWARATNTIIRTDLQRWRHDADGSGREITRRAPDLRGVDHQPTPQERDLFSKAPKTSTRYAPGELHSYLSQEMPADPADLAKLLAPAELAAKPAYPRLLVGGVVNLATSHYLNRPQRATTLRVLANVPGIDYRGPTTDLAGRPALAFNVVADGSTLTVLIAPATGEVLAAHERIGGGIRPGLFSYILVLSRGHSSTYNLAPPTAATG